jgi:pyruvate dehydrogenase E1 component beta subunit
LDAPVLRVTAEDVPLPYASNLEKECLPTTAKIIDKVKQVCYK